MYDIKCPKCERRLQLVNAVASDEYECPGCHSLFTAQGNVITSMDRGKKDTDEDFDNQQDAVIERARFVRSLMETEKSDATVRWQLLKDCVKVGFPFGIFLGIASLFVPPGSLFSEQWVYIFWNGVLGAGYAFTTVLIAHAWDQPAARENPPDTCLVVILASIGIAWLSLLTLIRVNLVPDFDPFSAMIVGLVGSLFVVPSQLMFKAGLALWRKSRRKK